MQTDDLMRELQKMQEVIDRVDEYMSSQNEANAALHMSNSVLYSPLTVAVKTVNKSMASLIVRLYDESVKKDEE